MSSCAAQTLPPRSVLMSYQAPIGLVAINTEPMATNQGFKRLVPDRTRVFEGYLYHWLAANTAYLQSLGNGATFKEVSKSVVQRIKIPLPPLDEQRRIAGILDATDALRRREALALLDTLPGAIFAEMFGALTTSDRFPRGPLSNLITGLDTGKNLAPASDQEGMRHRVLKVSAVTKGEFIETESKPLPADYSPPACHFVKPGDLLFSRANTSALIGATAMVENVSDNIVLPDKIWRFLLDEEKVEPIFLHYLPTSPPATACGGFWAPPRPARRWPN
ncbi:restriction endonuclease subunit S [Roseovarius sp. D22-M7]|uniref:restriction endonuclease subunit S n=1 Tax=Roseovarius sp. D22-M7 TaxID=3127116 RepID=UPI00300FC1C9